MSFFYVYILLCIIIGFNAFKEEKTLSHIDEDFVLNDNFTLKVGYTLSKYIYVEQNDSLTVTKHTWNSSYRLKIDDKVVSYAVYNPLNVYYKYKIYSAFSNDYYVITEENYIFSNMFNINKIYDIYKHSNNKVNHISSITISDMYSGEMSFKFNDKLAYAYKNWSESMLTDVWHIKDSTQLPKHIVLLFVSIQMFKS